MKSEYQRFLESKKHLTGEFGFEPTFFPEIAFDFQRYIIDKAVRKGRMAIFADTGLGKTLMQLSIAQNIVLKTNKRVLVLTPLAVGFQFVKESEKLGIPDVYQTLKGELKGKIIVCNYERLHYLNSSDFIGCVLDESSILKNFNGKIKGHITTFIKKMPYRFLSTATPSPNDYIEFGTSSEALGYLPHMDMLQRFFSNKENNFKPQDIGTKWYLKPHAKKDFFSWINTWSITVKMPSDLGFADDGYVLPELKQIDHFVKNPNNWIVDGQIMMFNGIARTMSEVRQEQQGSIIPRCEKAVELSDGKVSVYWCHFNNEGDLLQELDKGAAQVKGSDKLEKKEETLIAFAEGQIQRLITKPKITSFGLNWQHCSHTIYFPTWSYEQYYQSVRRFYRFGQKESVEVHRILSDGQTRVLDALEFKTNRANEFQQLIKDALIKDVKLNTNKDFNKQILKPKFL